MIPNNTQPGQGGTAATALACWNADETAEAGKLLEHLPGLWEKADPAQRHRTLLTMPDAVCVDTVDERRVVAIRPRPASRPSLDIATMRAGSGIVLVHDRVGESKTANQPPPGGQEADDLQIYTRKQHEPSSISRLTRQSVILLQSNHATCR